MPAARWMVFVSLTNKFSSDRFLSGQPEPATLKYDNGEAHDKRGQNREQRHYSFCHMMHFTARRDHQ